MDQEQYIVPLVPYRNGLLSLGWARARLSGVKGLIVLGGLDDSLQAFGAFGPSEGITGLVVAGEEAVEQFLAILLGMLDAWRQTLLAKDAEETFDEVHPRGMRGRVVKVDLRMANQPSPGRLVLVDVAVSPDHVEFPVWVGSHDVIHEAEEVYRGAPVADMGDPFAGGNLQGGDHGLRSVPDVLMGPALRFGGT